MDKYLLLGDSNFHSATDSDYEATAYIQGKTQNTLITNLAISGQMMRFARDYYATAIEKYPVRGVVCMLGSNDHWTADGYGDNAGDYFDYLVDLIHIRPIPWYVICPPPGRDKDKDYGGGTLATYRCMCKMAAEATGNQPIDSWKAVSYPEDYQDHIHLTDQGRTRLLDYVIQEIGLT